MATLGIIACQILELELAYLLVKDVNVSGITVLETGFDDGFFRAAEKKLPLRISDIGNFIPAESDRFEALVQIFCCRIPE